jgi:DNA polymerase theta
MDAGAKAGVRRRRQRFKTDGETLRALESQHAFPALVLEHRSLSKCAGAAEELVDLARSAGFVAGDGEACVRLRGTIHQTNAETGRLAMEEPNLQTIPRAVAVVGNDARDAGEGPSSLAVRGAFRAPAGRVLLSADYKQLELRVAAHLSGDETLLRAFENEQDPFGALASRWRGKTAFAAVDESDRAAAKRLAYAALFGGGVSKFAAETGCDEATARALMDTFKASMPGVERWRLSVVKEAAERTPPHVVTLGGRRRHLPGLAGNFAGAAFAAEARKAVNTTCQGSAADIVKRAMLDVFGKLTCSGSHGHENGAPSDARDASDDDDAPTWRRLRAGGCRLVLQVHDELVFELDEADAVAAVGAIRRVMERAARAFSLRVSLPVKVSVGWDYGEMTVAEY